MDDERSRRIGEEIAKACELRNKEKLASMTIGELVDKAALSIAIDMLKDEDFEKVVRCKDCKHIRYLGEGTMGDVICSMSDIQISRHSFCSEGKRREEQ